MRPDRHSFVMLAAPSEPPVFGGELAEVEAWRLANLPFVVASAHDGDAPDMVRLGLATPDKRRIGFCANVDALGTVEPPLSFDEARSHAPAAWSMILQHVSEVCRAADLDAFVFGSLAWTCRTGRDYLHEGSDLDLLLAPRPGADSAGICDAITTLMRPADGLPRLDGELRLADGSAVNLRELAQSPPEILVKKHGGARMARLEDVVMLVAAPRT